MYSKEAVAFAKHQLSVPQRDRTKSFSGSSTGSCARRQVFSYVGCDQSLSSDSQTNNIFHNGNFTHLRWQMAGLTAGWLTKVEVPVRMAEWRYKGTMDGILDMGWGFEFKSINSHGFRGVMQYGAKPDHQAQVQSYMLAADLEAFSVVYEDKLTNEWTETVVKRDEHQHELILGGLEVLNKHVENQVLPPVLPECKNGEGSKFRMCPYRHMCLEQKEWPSEGSASAS